jgi:CheY-like chemotaxis protein
MNEAPVTKRAPRRENSNAGLDRRGRAQSRPPAARDARGRRLCGRSRHDGEDGHYLGSTEAYDAIILDLGLPEVDGLTVLDRWRKDSIKVPVLVLTARDSWSDKVAGLDAGADDYLAKPFQTEELIARLRALIRRASATPRPS